MVVKKATKKTAAARAPRPRIAGSLADQIDNLKVGGSVATSQRFGIGEGTWDADDILESLRKQRNGLAAYVARVTDDGLDVRTFVVEGGTYLTDSKNAVVCSAAVTRVA